MIRKLIWLLVVVLLLSIVLVSVHWLPRLYFLKMKYQPSTSYSPVDSKRQIDHLLNSFEQIPYHKLEKSYLKNTLSNTKKYKPLLADKQYYEIEQADFFKKIVGNYLLVDFLPRDQYFKACLFHKDKKMYWLVDEKLLYGLLQLQQELEKKAHDPEAFTISHGHRHPAYNESISGASLSRHIKGEAIDLKIGDIDRSGSYEKVDKQIVLDLLEHKIIKSQGGVGRYPGTRAVHFDVRGYRARWDRM